MTDTPRSEAPDDRYETHLRERLAKMDATYHDRWPRWTNEDYYAVRELVNERAARQPAADTSGLRAFWNGDEPRRVIVELPPIGSDGRCTRCGATPSRDTGSCRCHRAIIERALSGTTPEATAPAKAREWDWHWPDAEATAPGLDAAIDAIDAILPNESDASGFHWYKHVRPRVFRALTEQQGSGS